MKFTLLTVVAAATIGLAAGNAGAHNLTIPHKSFAKMTVKEKVTWLKRQIHKDESIVRFWNNHRFLTTTINGLPSPTTGLTVAAQAALDTRWAQTSLRIAKKSLSKLVSMSSMGGFPPHHALWTCIGSNEGSPTSVNPNGHYGMLQMHADWGYGTSHHASDDPQSVQEWAAEKAYKASHYSQSFLVGQWLAYDGAYYCLKYA